MKKFFKTILSDRQLTVGCVLLLLLLFVAFAGPVLAPYDPYYYGSDILSIPGTVAHALGTNHLGQDIWSMSSNAP